MKKIIEWLPVIGILMLISSIPYGWSWYQSVSCWLLGLGYLSYVIAFKKWRDFRWDRTKWLYVIMLALWTMYPIRQLFDATPPTDYFWHQVHLHEWFLYIGIAGLIGFPSKLKLKYVAYVMLLTSVVMLAHSWWLYFFTDEMPWLIDSHMTLERFNELRMRHIHSHMVMNLYQNTAIILGCYAFRQDDVWWKRVLLSVGILCATTTIWISVGRIGQGTFVLILAIYLLYRLAHINRWLAIGSAAGCAILGVLMMTQVLHVKPLEGEPRFAVWDYSWRMVKEKPIVGYGLSTLSEKYVEEAYQDSVMVQGFIEPIIYATPDFSEQGKTMNTHHPHNAFLMYWLAVGIIGALLLAALFVAAACMPVGRDRIYYWLMLLAIFLQCLTEPIGAHLLPQFIAVMLFVWAQKAPDYNRER